MHSMVLPGLPSSTTVYFSGPGEVRLLLHFSLWESENYSLPLSSLPDNFDPFDASIPTDLLDQARRHRSPVPHARLDLGYKEGRAPQGN